MTLADELRFVRNYLSLEQLRLGDRLRVVERIDPDALDCVLPSLTLQPLVENAIKHGVAPRAQRRIDRDRGGARRRRPRARSARRRAGRARATIVEAATGVGLRAVRQRLETRYRRSAEFTVTTAPRRRIRRRASTLPAHSRHGLAAATSVAAVGARMKTRAVMVEDEPIARGQLRDLLSDVDWIECVGEAADGLTAVAVIDELKPDLVFLDIEMPELNGLDVLRRIAHDPAVVFTTAYDKFAVAAFELEAIDYLLKPFGRDRLLAALERVKRAVRGDGRRTGRAAAPTRRSEQRDRLGSRASSCATAGGSCRSPSPTSSASRRTTTTSPSTAAGRRFLVYLGMNEFEARLDPRAIPARSIARTS